MAKNINKTINRLRIAITFACVLNGLLAGENLFRYLLEVPGWRHIDISQWGEYSRNADLRYGAFFLPFEAIVGAILLIITSFTIIKNKIAFASGAFWVHLTTALALIGLGLTFFAGPYVLSVRTMKDDPGLLQQAFNHFHFWGSFRAMAQILSFLQVWLPSAKSMI